MSKFSMKKAKRINYEELANKVKSTVGKQKKSYTDDRFYYPERDPDGNGYAVIRFLEPDDEIPFAVQEHSHNFKNNGQWYIELCPIDIGEKCPACNMNSEAVSPYGKWESTPKQVQDVVRQRKRKMRYVTNILVVNDPVNPENNGKVFLYSFGKMIMDMIEGALEPTFPDDPKFWAFDPTETGRNFKLKITKSDGQTTYKHSGWSDPCALTDDEAEFDRIMNACYDLTEFSDPKRYKDYAALEERLNKVMGIHKTVGSPLPETAAAGLPETDQDIPPSVDDPEMEEAESYFNNL